MSTKDVIAQHIFVYDALYRRSSLLDQFQQGLKHMGVLEVIEVFPEEMSKLFTYTGEITTEEVLEAVYMETETEGLLDGDAFVFSLFQSYLKKLSPSG
jgi:hypothetical protein